MANTFSSVVDSIFAKSLMPLRENSIMARLVRTDFRNEVAQRGQVITIPKPTAATAETYTPAQVPPAGQDSEQEVVSITLNQWKKSDMFMTDKEAREIADADILDSQVAERVKALANDVDNYLFALYTSVYGFAGTAGTTPFASDLSAATASRKVLNNQLAPNDPRRIVINPDAEANALGLRAIQDASFRASQRGAEDNSLVTGHIGTVLGFDWYMSQNVPTHTAGTITTGLIAKASTAQAVGLETIVATTAASTGACALLVGDVIEIAGHDQTYTLTAAATQASAATDVNLSISPPLQTALAGSEAITVKASHAVNLAFHRDAFGLAVRPLAPAGGFTGGNEFRSAVDPVSGLAISLEVSREYGRTKWLWSVLYGASVLRPELAARLAG